MDVSIRKRAGCRQCSAPMRIEYIAQGPGYLKIYAICEAGGHKDVYTRKNKLGAEVNYISKTKKDEKADKDGKNISAGA